VSDSKKPKRILTGDRPTGRLHLGHWVGSIAARVKLQYEYETVIVVADLHMLTTKKSSEDIRQILSNTRGLVLDYLASGIDSGWTLSGQFEKLAKFKQLQRHKVSFPSGQSPSKYSEIRLKSVCMGKVWGKVMDL